MLLQLLSGRSLLHGCRYRDLIELPSANLNLCNGLLTSTTPFQPVMRSVFVLVGLLPVYPRSNHKCKIWWQAARDSDNATDPSHAFSSNSSAGILVLWRVGGERCDLARIKVNAGHGA